MEAVVDDINGLAATVWPDTAARRADGVVTIGGVSLVDVADRFGTPAMLFDETDFRGRCRRVRSAFAGFEVYYAGKAFLCKAVARVVAEESLALDVCSLGELAVTRAVGFPLERVVLHGNNKSVALLTEALSAGVGRIAVDALEEIELLSRLAARLGRRPRVLLRVTPDLPPATHAHNATGHRDQKFGIGLSDDAAGAVRRVLADDRLVLGGLHTHLGSQIFDPAVFEAAIRQVVAFLGEVAAEHGVELPELSLGGGFGVPYTVDDAEFVPERWAAALRSAVGAACRAHGLRSTPRLAVEPGRSLVARSGCTLYRVGVCKQIPGVRTYVSVDGGVSDNIRPALLGVDHTVTLANRRSDAPAVRVRVVGQHCDAGDVVVRDAHLPADVRSGDLLAVPVTGAYCRSWSNNYNHTPRPPVLALSGGRAWPIVRGETVDDLLQLDVG